MANRRSDNTCAECRARKVKCNGIRPICSPCERLGLGCSFRPPETGTHAAYHAEDAPAIRSRRTKAACKSCQILRVKCSGELPKCQRCMTKDLECFYLPSKRNFARTDSQLKSNLSPRSTQSPHSRSQSSTGSTLTREIPQHTRTTSSDDPSNLAGTKVPEALMRIFPSMNDQWVLRMLGSFFEHIQPLPVYSVFHRAILIHRYEAGLLNTSLLLALVGTACELLETDPAICDKGRECLSEAESLVVKDITAPAAVKIQTLVLVIRSHIRQGRMTAAFMLFAVACRAAYALKINHPAPKLCFLEQESRRRLMWSLFMIDTSLAGGIREFSLCPAQSIYVQLPCPERNFELDLEQETNHTFLGPSQVSSENLGTLGMYIQICWLRHRILEATKETVLSKNDAVNQLPAKVEELATSLAQFGQNLPSRLRFSTRSLQLRAYSPRLYPFILLHIWWRQCYCDLYRVVLTGLKEALRDEQIQFLPPEIVSTYRWKCFESAKELSSVLGSIATLKDRLKLLESDIRVCAYQCVRLLLQCFWQCDRSTGEVSEDIVQAHVNQCVEAVDAVPATSSMSERINDDFKKLLRRGRSTDPTPQRGNTPVHAISTHLFSRHSIIGQVHVSDDSSDITGSTLEHGHIYAPSSSRAEPGIHDDAHLNMSNSLGGSNQTQKRQIEILDVGILDAFQEDMNDLIGFGNDTNMVNNDSFGWSEGFWADAI